MTLKIDHALKITDVVMEWCGKCRTYTPHLLEKGLAGACTRCAIFEAKDQVKAEKKTEQLEMF